MNPGCIVRCRNRDWVLLPSDESAVYHLRPLTGATDEVVAVHKQLAELVGYELPEERLRSATFPLPGIEADVVDEKGNPLPPSEKGFLVIKRPWPGMFMTLYNDSERYREVYWTRFPGFYYPGDYALRDAEGYFWLLGRADEVIKVAGHRLGTREVEDALVSHPSVAEAAVAGKPDPVKGETIVAFVTLRKAANPSNHLSEELKQHVRRMIGPIATPESIYFARLLPKTRSGKIMRRVIKAVAAGGPIGDLSTLEDGASVDEIREAIEALRVAEKSTKSS